jgi:hypothetical protein
MDKFNADGLIEELLVELRQVPELIADQQRARLIRGILERQLATLTRIAAIEDVIARLASGQKQDPAA